MSLKKNFICLANGLIFLLLITGCHRSANSGRIKGNIFPKMHVLNFEQIRLEGEFGTRYQAATVNLLTHTDRYPPESFAASAAGHPGALWWDWPGDQIGRFLSCLHVAGGYGWSEAAASRLMVAEMALPLQNPEGNFGPAGSAASDDARIISGNAFSLKGLVDAFGDTGDKRYLHAAEKMARFFEMRAADWENRKEPKYYEFYGHSLDGLVSLYQITHNEPTLELAKRMAIHAGRTAHTHHSLSFCRGVIDLARVTGDTAYLQPVKDYIAWCKESQTADGGLPEAMPVFNQDEGCALADWIVVNLMMFEISGETRFIDDAEKTLVNHFFLNQFNTGGFGHLSFSQEIVGGKTWQGWDGKFGSENPGCCSLWGQWGLGQVGRFLVTEKQDALFVNLFASAKINLPDKYSHLSITGDFPRMSKAEIKLSTDKSVKYDLALRKPAWADSVEILINNKSVRSDEEGGYLHIKRRWHGTSVVQIRFVSGYRIFPWPKNNPVGVAIYDGPLCMGLPCDRANVDAGWILMTDDTGLPVLDTAGRPQVSDSAGIRQTWLEPVGSRWLDPDVREPLRRRILYRSYLLLR